MTIQYDANVLESSANEYIRAGRLQDAIKIYLFMADGDRSLDGGYLGERLGQCYELCGDLHAAKYWYGRGLEEIQTPALPVLKHEIASRTLRSAILCLQIRKSKPRHPRLLGSRYR